MQETVAAQLETWWTFYVIVGSSAGALTGLQFVVMTLIADSETIPGRGESISAFGTPNVVHFCAALLVSAILSIPWSVLPPAGIAVAGCGALGVVYSAIVARRALRQRAYEPVLEDWLWHGVLPALAYGTLLVAGAILGRNVASALFVIGPAALLLVFVGIHNAWDTVTFVTVQRELGLRARREAAARTSTDVARVPAPGSAPAPGAASPPEPPAPPTQTAG